MSTDDHVPKALQDYLDLDLSLDGNLVKDLLGKVSEEARLPMIAVSMDRGDGSPAHVTTVMSNWYHSSVAPRRADALNAVHAQFGQDVVSGLATSLLEGDIDSIRGSAQKGTVTLIDTFKGSAGSVAEKLQETKHRYESLKANAGREAKPINFLRDGIALALLAIPELLMNFTSFVKIEYLNPFFAGAISIIVAVGIGFASHIHAVFIRQGSKIFGAHTAESDRAAPRWVFWAATALLGGCMALVAWGRYAMLADAIREAMLLGGSAYGSYLLFAGAMIGNVLVYLIGAIGVYLVTDPIPGYAEAHRDLQVLEKRYENLYLKELDRPLKQKLAEAEERIRDRRTREQTLRAGQSYDTNRRLFEMLKAKDGNIVARLNEYRTALAQKVIDDRWTRKTAPEPVAFSIDGSGLEDLRRGSFRTPLTASQYVLKEIKLSYAQHN